jgi:hypothetical protein
VCGGVTTPTTTCECSCQPKDPSRTPATRMPKASRCHTRHHRPACSLTSTSCQTKFVTYKSKRWARIVPGDSVRLRPKRVPGPRVEVTVDRLLERNLADGLGFVDEDGVTFREYYYDAEVFTPPAP